MKSILTGRIALLMLSILVLSAGPLFAQHAPGTTIDIRQGVAMRMRLSGRTAVTQDPVAYRLAMGQPVRPAAGDSLPGCGIGDCLWEAVEADSNGVFSGRIFGGGYLVAQVHLKKAGNYVLETSGPAMVYVDGAPRTGDVYDYGWARLPVSLARGNNTLLFQTARGRVRARLVPVTRRATFAREDLTVPDVVRGERGPYRIGVRVLNNTDQPSAALQVRATVDSGEATVTTLPEIGPLTSRKVPATFVPMPTTSGGRQHVRLELLGAGKRVEVLDTMTVVLDVVGPSDRVRRTFISDIDGSLQYYTVVPGGTEGGKKPALFLSLHGASVESINQARAYEPKTWGHIVTPTNRRPYGFDWEEWGRMDALEVLGLAEQSLGTDPMRTYLTGHSMGGHGTWHVGATFPDRFAAIAPICGWYSWWSYGLTRPDSPTDMEAAQLRAMNTGHTVEMLTNYLNHGVYIMHGGKDDVVPVQQARFMRAQLASFHKDFSYYEYPNVGHWWTNESVDFAPIFEYFRWHRRNTSIEQDTVRFTTANPGVSARSYWAEIVMQAKPLAFSRIHLTRDTVRTAIVGTTENVAVLGLDLTRYSGRDTVRIELDGHHMVLINPEKQIWLNRDGAAWVPAAAPGAAMKGPHRNGTFRDGFRNRFVLVYGTRGTPEENRWAYDKARYDAESFWYRGNGAVDVVKDVDFDAAAEPDRGVVLYGNADNNAAWDALLGQGPVRVTRREIRIGSQVFTGDDLGTYFVRPRPGSSVASVSVVAGTGLAGLRAAEPNAYFKAGAGFPDVMVFDARMLRDGADGVRLWGYFGNDWSVENGEWLIP